MTGSRARTGTGAHASPGLIERYAAGAADISPDAVWTLEAHLEGCGQCRDGLAEAVRRRSKATVALLDRVHAGLNAELAQVRQAPARRRALRWLPGGIARRWAAPSLFRWLLVMAIAVLFDLASQAERPGSPSLVLLLAPVAPLFGVAAAWARRSDPTYEVVAAALYLVLQRTLTVLLVVIPALAGAGWIVGTSPARWLLPCLAFTAGTLALGGAIGVPRAATGLGLLWTAAVIVPSLATDELSVALRPGSLPAWAALTAGVTVVLALRRGAFTRLQSLH